MQTPEPWAAMQYKSFLRWVNAHLRRGGFEPISALEDLGKGFALLKLLNILAEEKFPESKIKKSAIASTVPKSKFEQIDCLSQCFQFIKDEKIHIENIGPDDLLKENQKIILGLVWSLIRHYQINKGLKGLQSNEDPVLESMLAGPSAQTQPIKPPIKKWTRVKVDPPPPPPTPPPPPPVNFYLTANDEDNPPPPPPPPPLPPYVVFEEVEVITIEPTVTPAPTTNAKNTVSGSTAVKKNDKSGDNTRTVLLREVQRRLAPDHTDLVVNDFSSSFADGRVFCALVHQADPHLIDYNALQSKSNEERLSTAFDILEHKMGAFKILEAEDFVNVKQIDEKSVMTYVATVLPAIDKYKNMKLLQSEEESKRIEDEKKRFEEERQRLEEEKKLRELEEQNRREEEEQRRIEDEKKKVAEQQRIEEEKKRIEVEKRKKEIEEKKKQEEVEKKSIANAKVNKSPISSPATPKRSASPIRVNVVAPKSPKKKKAYKVPVKFYDSSDSSDSEEVIVNVKFSKNSVSVSYTPKTAKK
jgi:hypothetical protein